MFRWLLFTIVTLGASVTGSDFVELDGEVRINLSSDWSLQADTAGYPYHITNNDAGAEILIFRNFLDSDEAIRDREELKLSVDNVVADIILELPEARLMSTTGYSENGRVRFELEFLTTDTTANIPLWHRFVGHIYTHPEGYQLLFTVWAKCPLANAEIIRSDFDWIAGSLDYYGPVEPTVFGPRETNPNWTYSGALVVLLLVLLLIRRRQTRLNSARSSDSALHWRCDCGRLNSNDLNSCKHCGQLHPQEPVT